MTARRIRFACTSLLMVGVVFWLSRGRASGDVAAMVAEPVQRESRLLRADATVASAVEELATTVNPVHVVSTKTAPIKLTASEAARLTEEIELRTLAEKANLHLTAEQWAAFVEVALCHQAIRHAYEAEIATVSTEAGGLRRMEIPVYGAAGDALRATFYAGLRASLGPSAAEEIAAKLGAALEGRFAGFGVAVQTLDFVSEEAAESDVSTRVTRTVVFGDGTSDGARLNTRQDVYFPEIEDPSGDVWGALLARLETGSGKKARG